MKRLVFLLSLLFSPLASTVFAAEKAHYLVPPEVIIPHTAERSFIGPGMFVFETGDILMAAPWGRPPTNFEEVAAKFPVPMLYRSKDGGRTWKEQGRMRMEWNLTGLISDGGTSFLRLRDGRLAVVFNRHVRGLHGGGTPVIAFSSDDGDTWTAARTLLESDDAFYVMNDRLIQLRTGRLVLPVARKAGKTEGDRDEGLAMLSDDSGATWRLSRGKATIEAPRGMAEPCVAELEDGRVLMLGRTGLGFLHAALSADGGETWSAPGATTLESACSSLTLKTLPDGRLIVFYNHATPIKAGAFFPRTPLCYAVSGDGGSVWSAPVVVDDEGVADKDRQNIYPSICFTREGMVVMWSTHGADPQGSFKGQYDPNIGGGKRAILALPAGTAPSADTTGDVRDVRVVRRWDQHPGSKLIREPCIAEWKPRHLVVSYGVGISGKTDMGDIYACNSTNDGNTWSEPVPVFDHNQRFGSMQFAYANPVLYKPPGQDVLWCFAMRCPMNYQHSEDSQLVGAFSADGGRSWTPVDLAMHYTGPLIIVAGIHRVVENGQPRYLLPAHRNTKRNDPLGTRDQFLLSSTSLLEWSLAGHIPQPEGGPVFLHEGSLAPGDKGTDLKMVMRTAQFEKEAKALETPRAFSSVSQDGGRTWSAAREEPELWNSVSKGFYGRAANGTHLYVYNDGPAWSRMGLKYKVKPAGGAWSPEHTFFDAGIKNSYPTLIETTPGEFRAVWDSGDAKTWRRSIRFGKFTLKTQP